MKSKKKNPNRTKRIYSAQEKKVVLLCKKIVYATVNSLSFEDLMYDTGIEATEEEVQYANTVFKKLCREYYTLLLRRNIFAQFKKFVYNDNIVHLPDNISDLFTSQAIQEKLHTYNTEDLYLRSIPVFPSGVLVYKGRQELRNIHWKVLDINPSEKSYTLSIQLYVGDGDRSWGPGVRLVVKVFTKESDSGSIIGYSYDSSRCILHEDILSLLSPEEFDFKDFEKEIWEYAYSCYYNNRSGEEYEILDTKGIIKVFLYLNICLDIFPLRLVASAEESEGTVREERMLDSISILSSAIPTVHTTQSLQGYTPIVLNDNIPSSFKLKHSDSFLNEVSEPTAISIDFQV